MNKKDLDAFSFNVEDIKLSLGESQDFDMETKEREKKKYKKKDKAEEKDFDMFSVSIEEVEELGEAEAFDFEKKETASVKKNKTKLRTAKSTCYKDLSRHILSISSIEGDLKKLEEARVEFDQEIESLKLTKGSQSVWSLIELLIKKPLKEEEILSAYQTIKTKKMVKKNSVINFQNNELRKEIIGDIISTIENNIFPESLDSKNITPVLIRILIQRASIKRASIKEKNKGEE